MNRYSRVHAQLVSAPDIKSFFAPALLGTEAVDPFFWEHAEPLMWGDTLGYDSGWKGRAGSAVNGILELLYDDVDLKKTDFDLGYIGKAHIGSLHMYKIIEEATAVKDSAVQMFLNELRNAAAVDARLLVVGSVFGGTGASGLPAIPSILSSLKDFKDIRKRISVAGLLLTPYFMFPRSLTRADGPDSVMHPLTAQAALYHYTSGATGYDRVYVLGAPQVVTTNTEHAEGGAKQANKPHYVEIAAAMAAAHFFMSPRGQTNASPKFFGCNTNSVRNWEFPFANDVKLRARIREFTTFCLFHALLVDPELDGVFADHSWRKLIGLTKNSAGYRELTNFSFRYLLWVRALVELREKIPKGADIGQDAALLFSPQLLDHLGSVPDPNDEQQVSCASLLDASVLAMATPSNNAQAEGARLWKQVMQTHLGVLDIRSLKSATPVGRYMECMTLAIRAALVPETAGN